MNEQEQWRELGQQLRVDSVRAAAAAGSGHPTSSMSAADLMAVLLAKYLHYDFDAPENPLNDHLVFSKGHASPLVYSITARQARSPTRSCSPSASSARGSRATPRPIIPWVDVATGSLGQGLPIAVGIALAGKRLDRLPFRVWVLCGDSEMAEGSMWEAFAAAAHERLDNLVAIIDVNRLGQRGETMLGWNTAAYVARAEAFGWRAIEIDGHDVAAIDAAYEQAAAADGQPVAIIARTLKGKGVAAVENKNGWHGKPLADPEAAIAELGGRRDLQVRPQRPRGERPRRTGSRPRGATGGVGGRREGRHQAGLRRRARRGRRRRRPRRRARRRGRQLHLLGALLRCPPRPLLRDVHRRAAARGGGRGHAGAGLGAVRVHLRRVPGARLRLHPHGGRSARRTCAWPARTPASRSARTARRRWRSRTWPRSGPCTARPCSTRAARTRPRSSSRRWSTGRHRLHAHDPREPAGALPGRRAVPDRRLAARALVDSDDVTIVAAGITLHEALAAAETLAGEGISTRVHRPLLGEADRRGDAGRGSRGDRRHRGRRGPLARGRHPRGRARGALERRGERARDGARADGHADLGHAGRAARPGRDRPRPHRHCRSLAGRREAVAAGRDIGAWPRSAGPGPTRAVHYPGRRMRRLTLWVRTASTARLVAVGVAVAVAFVAANAFASLDTGGARPPQPATLSGAHPARAGQHRARGDHRELPLRRLARADHLADPAGERRRQLAAAGHGRERAALVRPRAAADGVPDRPGRHPARRARHARAHVRRVRRHRLRRHAAHDRDARPAAHRPCGGLTGARAPALDAPHLDARAGGHRRQAVLHGADGAAPEHGPAEQGGALGRRRHRHAAAPGRVRPRPAQAAGRVRPLEHPLRAGRPCRVPAAAPVRHAPRARALRRPAVARRDGGVHGAGTARRAAPAELPRGQPLGRAPRPAAAVRPVVRVGRRPGAARRRRPRRRPVGPPAVGVRLRVPTAASW